MVNLVHYSGVMTAAQLTSRDNGELITAWTEGNDSIAGYWWHSPDPAFDPECVGYITPSGLRIYATDEVEVH